MILKFATRSYCNFNSKFKPMGKNVAVLGASGGIGQPLSLLLTLNNLVSELRLYDVVNTAGIALDLNHIDSNTKVKGYSGEKEICDSLDKCDLVIIPAGVPRKPGMTRDDLFDTNASIVKNLAKYCARICPKAFLAIVTNPINSTVPIVSEVFKEACVYDPKKIFGVTTLDIIRAKKLVSVNKELDVTKTSVDVIGGHAGETIVPLLSTFKPEFYFLEEPELCKKIQNAGTEVVKAKAGTGSATLSMAYAAAKFANSLLKAMNGEEVYECAYVKYNNETYNLGDYNLEEYNLDKVTYFSVPLKIGKNGIEEYLKFKPKTVYEKNAIKNCVFQLGESIKKGVEFVKNNK